MYIDTCIYMYVDMYIGMCIAVGSRGRPVHDMCRRDMRQACVRACVQTYVLARLHARVCMPVRACKYAGMRVHMSGY